MRGGEDGHSIVHGLVGVLDSKWVGDVINGDFELEVRAGRGWRSARGFRRRRTTTKRVVRGRVLYKPGRDPLVGLDLELYHGVGEPESRVGLMEGDHSVMHALVLVTHDNGVGQAIDFNGEFKREHCGRIRFCGGGGGGETRGERENEAGGGQHEEEQQE